MNEDSNKYLLYFIAMTAIFCLSTGIIHKITNSITKKNTHNKKKKQNLEENFSSSSSSNDLSNSSTQNNWNETFDERVEKNNLPAVNSIKLNNPQRNNLFSTNSPQNRINYMHSNGENYSFKLYEKYQDNPLFKEIASKALIYNDFLAWFKYCDELEQIFKNEKLSKLLLNVLENKNKNLSQNEIHKIYNDTFYTIIKTLNKSKENKKKEKNIKSSLNSKYIFDATSTSSPYFLNDDNTYFSLEDYKKYQDNPLFKEIASKALIQLDFLYWFSYKKELQIIFNNEAHSNCLLEILQNGDKELAQLVFYNIVNKNKEHFVKNNQKNLFNAVK